MDKYYQKYIFKIKGSNIVTSKDVLIRNLTQNPDKLDIQGNLVRFQGKSLDIKLTYHNKSDTPTGIIKVSGKNIEDLEIFNSVILEIINTEQKFTEFKCIYDGVSSYYSTTIYSKLHEIERKTQEFLKELFYISDNSGELKEFRATLNEMDKKDFSFSKLINHIFKRADVTEKFLSHIESCIETESVPNRDLFPKNFWDTSTLTGDSKEGLEINKLLEEVRNTRNTVAHCGQFSKKNFEKCNETVCELSRKLDEVINSIESMTDASESFVKEAERINNSFQSDESEIKQKYFKFYDVFEDDLRGRTHNSEINWDKGPALELKAHRDFYTQLSEKTDEEIKEEIERLERLNNIGDDDIITNNVTSVKSENDDDIYGLTLIVPAQEDGFKQVFLKDKEWYDIRIGKYKRNKIKYIAAYEVAPRSGIQYTAKVKKIVPSDNYVGYWKVVFDGDVQSYNRLIPLGNTYPPQNIRYTTKKELDDLANGDGTLEDIFKNPY